ncbi:PREDICTED: 39S ribosomal protein L3, mitochondrial-like isoform X2 [Priapulus caudatus]|uniref:Large ribosomal subunit protein uL3m n=1 Tax=Priapulus caudatus TaxID=37621 RepID=A0ABM1EW53_PRICU|nr:PREDICTED: 39S ribosomal protein L3, mitochondrial-like isoform X2 [Priapulus caudatus]
MAASMRRLLPGNCGRFIQNVLPNERLLESRYSKSHGNTFQRTLPYVQFRMTHSPNTPAPWWTKKLDTSAPEDLTSDNEAFLQDMVEEKYSVDSPLKEGPWERADWTPRSVRCGLICRKIGVIPQWLNNGKKFYTTLLQFKAEYLGLFQEAGVMPKHHLSRFFVTRDAVIQPGTQLNAMHFSVGDFVDCQARTIDHGYQGVVKKWGMKGGPASHGATKFHRKMGATGGGGNMARIWPGKKMPGHMGNEWRILKGLKIWRINTKYNVLYVHGPCVPGPHHCYVRVMDTILPLRKRKGDGPKPPFPTWFADDYKDQEIPEEIFDESLHRFTASSIEFEEEK